MKANEVPEKIYVEITHPISDEYTEIIAFEDCDGIEYTCTDAFIEKAVNWFRAHWRDYVGIDKDNVIHFGLWENDFKNYMKGE